ncbi:hypothetical protein P879_04017 [Paragonimus westermani]|uniref:Uncharacterized protein n=1 Tax=Paragonimus westermani TaxID=34504 RepID=A0A8T0DVW8_9TREM|nr:hypothetical protein P879_04017 [Paragonimus westermani]
MHPTVISCESMNSLWHENTWNTAWDTWWHYKEGVIGGPSHWGQTAYMAYAEDVWPACHQGKLQSPIVIISSNLTYDPNLKPLEIVDKEKQVGVSFWLNIQNAGCFETISGFWLIVRQTTRFPKQLDD